ncbi:hypothetical protein C8Q75DRAFT_785619 [Abortiporus biennis]|nr:hypothetical protein C8Q75DRAFT_785619 [Abortiporus biennis]
MSLSQLPPELVLNILLYLPVQSLHNVEIISRSWHTFFSENATTIFHQAAFHHGLVNSMEDDLSDAISKHFVRFSKGITDWRSFCKHLLHVERSWAGFGSASYHSSSAAEDRVHRIKIDEQRNLLFTTHVSGGLRVIDLGTDTILWQLSSHHVRSWAHCEYSNGFLIFDRRGSHKEVWRLASEYNSTPQPVDNLPDSDQWKACEDAANQYGGMEGPGHFKPWALLTSPEMGRAFRFVYPTLLVASFTKAYLYDIESAQLVQTIKDVQPSPIGNFGSITYVELNQDYVFICSIFSLTVFSRATGACVLSLGASDPAWPTVGLNVPKSNGDIFPSSAVPIGFSQGPPAREPNPFSMGFLGAHVWENHLAATLSDNRLILIRDYVKVIKGEHALNDSILEIDLRSEGHRSTTVYLAFEFGRVGVVSSTGVYIFTLDPTKHHIFDETSQTSFSKRASDRLFLGHTPYPHLLASRLRYFDADTYLRNVSCLQMTESKLYITYTPKIQKMRSLLGARGEDVDRCVGPSRQIIPAGDPAATLQDAMFSLGYEQENHWEHDQDEDEEYVDDVQQSQETEQAGPGPGTVHYEDYDPDLYDEDDDEADMEGDENDWFDQENEFDDVEGDDGFEEMPDAETEPEDYAAVWVEFGG